MSRRLKLFFDGGCRPNPGRMEIAVVAAGRTEIVGDLGHGTSLDAEWLALIHALKVAQSFGAGSSADAGFVLLGDAVNVIGQATGRVTCRAASLRHYEAFRAMTSAGPPPRIRYVKRSQNLAGIALSRMHER